MQGTQQPQPPELSVTAPEHGTNTQQQPVQSFFTASISSVKSSAANPLLVNPCGNQLNAVDTQWAAGIEQLLPTPIFRLRVMKERLVRERGELEAELDQYLALKTPSSQAQVKQLRQKLYTLQRHETRVDAQIKALFYQRNGGFGWFTLWQRSSQGIKQWFSMAKRWLSPLHWLYKADPVRQQLANANRKLSHVTQLTEKRLSDPTITAAELADMLSTYDTLTAQLVELETRLTQATLWDHWRRLLKI